MKEINNNSTTHWGSYGVFCIAQLTSNGNTRELDVAWEDAIKLYEEFLQGPYNSLDKSELECINEFLNSKQH